MTTKHTVRPFIWLQETEDFGSSKCGCILERRENDSSAFLMCPVHDAAPELLEALQRCRELLLDSVNFNEGDKATTGAVSIADVVLAKAEGRP